MHNMTCTVLLIYPNEQTYVLVNLRQDKVYVLNNYKIYNSERGVK